MRRNLLMPRNGHPVMRACLSIMPMFPFFICDAQAADEIDALRRAAKAEIAEASQEDTQKETFSSGALGLQKLNPEISVTGDLLWSYTESESADKTSDFVFRGLGIHAEAYLDPYTRFKAAFSVSEDDTHLGEAYMTRFGIVPNVNLTLGKFRQQFGVVNRWHKHGLDQVDFPLALRQIFGPAGLNQTGGSFEWTMSGLAGCSQEAVFQVTDGENGRVFAENTDNKPSVLGHYKLFRDITSSIYAEIGFSALWGRNNEWTVGEDMIDRERDAWVLGADLTVLWEPTERMRYRNVTLRTEAYALEKDILVSDGSGEDTINAWGVYSYLESKISRTIIIGVRGDYFEPDVKPYASAETVNLAPLAVTEDGAYRWQVGPYVTWHQSPFVHFRAEYNHQDGDGTGAEEDVLWLQCIFAAGPHKHERY
jgi:hypothetical protein